MEIHMLAEKVSSIFVSMLISTILVNWFKSLQTESYLGDKVGPDTDLRQTPCPLGFFRLNWMSYCHPWLDCDDIKNDVKFFDNVVLSYGPPRLVRLAKWQTKLVAHNVPIISHTESFHKELNWLQTLGKNRNVLQLVGFCEDEQVGQVFITEYHKHGSALKVNEVLAKNWSLPGSNIVQRLKFCLSFAELLHNLEKEKLGLQNTPEDNADALLSRMLIGESPLRLILNNLDILKSYSNFQLSNETQNNEVVSVYSAPKVCSIFLKGQDEKIVKSQLKVIHRQCRHPDPDSRPSSLDLYKSYQEVLRKLQNKTFK